MTTMYMAYIIAIEIIIAYSMHCPPYIFRLVNKIVPQRILILHSAR